MISFSKPSITQEEIDEVTKVLNSSWITVGPKVKEFEEALGKYTGHPNVVAVDSCTSALTLSMTAIKSLIGDHCEKATVLVPALTFVATANAAYHAGFEIEFGDVDWDGNLNADILKKNYALIVPVHFAGQVCDLKKLSDYGSFIIEDAAHAIGARYEHRHIGATYSHGACFSFYPTKNMTTIEGGAFISHFEGLTDKVRKLSLHGLDATHINRYERSSLSRPTVGAPGFKANMTDVEAAIGVVQLKRLNSFITRRKEVASIYYNELSKKARFLSLNGRDHVWHMVVCLVEDRDNLVTKLKEHGIGTGIHYSPIIPAHPFYSEMVGYRKGQFPVAEYIADHCISLPLYNDITDEEVEKVIEVMKGLL